MKPAKPLQLKGNARIMCDMVAGTRVFTGAKKGSPSGCKKLGKHGSRKGAVRPGSAGHTSTAEACTYYYHSDHLGSAHLITDYKGDEYERIEYTPYGEYWIEKRATENRTLPFKFTGKERDEETGLYYYGARYLDAKTSRWLTTDPALSDYIPLAPVNDEAKKHNQNLPGMGGIYNTVNMHLYHYAGNNPIRYTDPTGEDIELVGSEEDKQKILSLINTLSKTQYTIDKETGKICATEKINEEGSGEYSDIINQGIDNKESTIRIGLVPEVGLKLGRQKWNLNNVGGGITLSLDEDRSLILIAITGKEGYATGIGNVSPEEVLMHELAAHAIPLGQGGKDNQNAIDIDNTLRKSLNLKLRPKNPAHTVGNGK